MSQEPKRTNITVSYAVAPEVVRTVEYRAYLDRTTKSDAMSKLVTEGARSLGQETPETEQEKVA